MKNLKKIANFSVTFLLLPLLNFGCGDFDRKEGAISENGFIGELDTYEEMPVDPSQLKNLASVTDCGSSLTDNINATADWISDNWSGFEDYVEGATGYNIKSCLKKRLESNGKVKCVGSTDLCANAYGWAVPGDKTMRICTSFRDFISELSTSLKRTYIADLLSHEFSHSCGRPEVEADAIGVAAFDYFYINY